MKKGNMNYCHNESRENKKYCSGCHACYSICPKGSIAMRVDEEGFWYPKIDESKCIKCGLCERVCPIEQVDQIQKNPIKAYAAINNRIEQRMNSSSGGIFCLLAECVILQKGVVFGAKFNEEFQVIHDFVEDIENLSVFYGSKYVQSEIRDTYMRVKDFLEDGRIVLFSGTPCQIAGLKTFLREDYGNLWTVDVLCHGVPSPEVWKTYISYLKKDKDIKKVSFRDKKFGWKMFSMTCEFSDESIYRKVMLQDMYMQGFLKNLYLRPSCYNCKFKGEKRFGDVSLGDFWGIEAIFPKMNDDKGISLLVINSFKGWEMLKAISKSIELKQAPMEALTKYNPAAVSSVEEHPQRDEFFKNFKKLDADILFTEYCKNYCDTNMKAKMILIKRRLEENHSCIAEALQKHFSDGKGVYLWGSGTYGKMMCRYLKEKGIKVIAFIDNSKEKVGLNIEGVDVISFTDLGEDNINIFVTVASRNMLVSIKEQISNKFQNTNILTFEDLYGYKSIKGLLWE